jgi:hypothetical protein
LTSCSGTLPTQPVELIPPAQLLQRHDVRGALAHHAGDVGEVVVGGARVGGARVERQEDLAHVPGEDAQAVGVVAERGRGRAAPVYELHHHERGEREEPERQAHAPHEDVVQPRHPAYPPDR